MTRNDKLEETAEWKSMLRSGQSNATRRSEGVERFVSAQEDVWDVVLSELRAGEKRGHWMWYIFPQLRGLGMSSMAHIYGISGLEEAKAYLEHPWLSGRLYELCVALLKHKDKSAIEIFGDVDAMKLKSSMTLLAEWKIRNM